MLTPNSNPIGGYPTAVVPVHFTITFWGIVRVIMTLLDESDDGRELTREMVEREIPEYLQDKGTSIFVEQQDYERFTEGALYGLATDKARELFPDFLRPRAKEGS